MCNFSVQLFHILRRVNQLIRNCFVLVWLRHTPPTFPRSGNLPAAGSLSEQCWQSELCTLLSLCLSLVTRSGDCVIAAPFCWSCSCRRMTGVCSRSAASWLWAPGGWRMPPPGPRPSRRSRTWWSSPRSSPGPSPRAPSPACRGPAPGAGPACWPARGSALRTSRSTWRSWGARAWPPRTCRRRWSPPRRWWRPCTWCSSSTAAWSCPDPQHPRC